MGGWRGTAAVESTRHPSLTSDRRIRMSTRIKAATVAIAGLALVALVARDRMPAASAADAHATHAMTPEQHLAHSSAAGDIHAGHALDEITWAATPLQAGPAAANLPPDDAGAAERLAKSP